MATTGAGLWNRTAGAIAKGAMKMMVWTKVKVVAVGVALLLTIQLIVVGQVGNHGGEAQMPTFSLPKTEWLHIESKYARTEERKREISGEAPDTRIIHFNPVTEVVIYEVGYPDHRTVNFYSPAEGLRRFYDSRTGEITVNKLSRTTQQLREEFEIIYSTDWLKLRAMGLIKNIPEVSAVRSKDGDLDRYIVTIKDPGHSDLKADPINIWVDPSTGRYQKLVTGILGETRTDTFTYGEPSIRDIYDLKVLRSTKVVPATGAAEMPATVAKEGLECMLRMRDVAAAINEYANRNDMHLPPDLGATLPYLKALRAKPAQTEGRWTELTPMEKARSYLCPTEARGVGLPTEVTADWINQHSSFVYLGNADIVMSKVGGNPGKIVILYDGLAGGHADISGRIPVFFLDGHGEGVDRAEADRLVAESGKALEAARTTATTPAE